MKKIISLWLMVAMLFSVSAFAEEEEFALHSGTKFGMSSQEVAQIEQENGFEMDVYHYEVSGGYSVYGRGRIANMDNTTMSYTFTDDDSLYDLLYEFYEGDDDLAKTLIKFETIEEGLVAKYGATEYCSETGFSFPVLGFVNWSERFKNKYPYDGGVEYKGTQAECSHTRVAYSHRLIEMDDGSCVLIDHVVYRERMKMTGSDNYQHQLRYILLTEEEAQLIRQSMNQFINDL